MYLTVREHISETTRSIFPQFLHVPMSSRGSMSDMLFISGFTNDVIFAHTGQEWADTKVT